MKKHLICILCLTAFFAAMTVCYAGDVPEGLLSNADAQVFFGEVKNVDGKSITMIQREKIKGDVVQDREITYPNHTFFMPKGEAYPCVVGEQYLCGFFDDINPLYAWEVSSLDTATLETASRDDMSVRMQQYLNNEEFAAREQLRLEDIKKAEGEEAAEAETAAAASVPAPEPTARLPVFVPILLCCTAMIVCLLLWKKRTR